MEPLVWLTDDLEILPLIEATASGLGTTVHVCMQLEELPQTRVPIILWWPAVPDEAIFLQLIEHCDQVIQLQPRGRHHERLCPIRSEGAPRYYFVVPFDPEELQVIIRGIVERIAQKRAMAHGEQHGAVV